MYNKASKEEIDEFFKKFWKDCDERGSIIYPYIPIYHEEYLFITGSRNCLHDSCPECHGSGRKSTGELCVHFISCPCPKCTPQ